MLPREFIPQIRGCWVESESHSSLGEAKYVHLFVTGGLYTPKLSQHLKHFNICAMESVFAIYNCIKKCNLLSLWKCLFLKLTTCVLSNYHMHCSEEEPLPPVTCILVILPFHTSLKSFVQAVSPVTQHWTSCHCLSGPWPAPRVRSEHHSVWQLKSCAFSLLVLVQSWARERKPLKTPQWW